MSSRQHGWRKILYEDQGVPDNYTDDTFLDSMKQNVNTKIYNFREVIFESGVVSQQISIIFIFVGIFIYLDTGYIRPTYLIVFTFVTTALYIFLKFLYDRTTLRFESFVTVPALAFAFSPILQTLTRTISTDTIYAMSTAMLFVNLLLHDYGAGVAMVSKAFSLNAALFAAVCLASRLPSSWHVYAYVMLAIQLFALFPEIRRNAKRVHRKMYILLTELLMLLAVVLFIPLSHMVCISLTVAHIAVTFVFPLWMTRLQRLKNNIEGPWDEGVVVR